MPYIKKSDRLKFEKTCETIGKNISNDGELNYVISKIIHSYIQETELRYHKINEIIGVLECAKMEFYKTIAGPYENEKMNENDTVSKLDKSFMIEENQKSLSSSKGVIYG